MRSLEIKAAKETAKDSRLRIFFAVSCAPPIPDNLFFEFANYSWAPCALNRKKYAVRKDFRSGPALLHVSLRMLSEQCKLILKAKPS